MPNFLAGNNTSGDKSGLGRLGRTTSENHHLCVRQGSEVPRDRQEKGKPRDSHQRSLRLRLVISRFLCSLEASRRIEGGEGASPVRALVARDGSRLRGGASDLRTFGAALAPVHPEGEIESVKTLVTGHEREERVADFCSKARAADRILNRLQLDQRKQNK